MRPGNVCELRHCRQKKGENLREYIPRFSKRCAELPDTTDNQVITAFQDGTTCETLVHRIGRVKPKTNRKLLDLATDHANGEEAVAFRKRKPEEEQGEAPVTRPEKKKKKERKLRNNNLVAVAGKRPSKPYAGPLRDYFKKMLEAPCLYHETPVKYAMKDCNLMKRYLSGKNKPQDATNTSAAKSVEHDNFPKEDGTVMMIFGGRPAHPPRRKHKRILQEIYHTEPTVPSYLRWSETAVTYD
jgi:hypothetical protein